jgi:hypothetical protein
MIITQDKKMIYREMKNKINFDDTSWKDESFLRTIRWNDDEQTMMNV